MLPEALEEAMYPRAMGRKVTQMTAVLLMLPTTLVLALLQLFLLFSLFLTLSHKVKSMK